MPNFSFFWKKHYDEIGNCCMTYPLKKLAWINPDNKESVPRKFEGKQLVIDFIDVNWMYAKKLKWIGWDIQGWLAWTDDNGMLYRIKDLKRNEVGQEFEKEVNEVKCELSPMVHTGNPSAEELYRFERDMQRKCGFCPEGQRSAPADEQQEKLQETRKPPIVPAWEKFINGDAIVEYGPSPKDSLPVIDVTYPVATIPQIPLQPTPPPFYKQIEQSIPDFPQTPQKKKGTTFDEPNPQPFPCEDYISYNELFDGYNKFRAIYALEGPTRALEYLKSLFQFDKIMDQRAVEYDLDPSPVPYNIMVSNDNGGLQSIQFSFGNLQSMTDSFYSFLDGAYNIIHENIHAWEKRFAKMGKDDQHNEREVIAHFFNISPNEFFAWRAKHYPQFQIPCISFPSIPKDFINKTVNPNDRNYRKLFLINKFNAFFESLSLEEQEKYSEIKNQVDYVMEQYQ